VLPASYSTTAAVLLVLGGLVSCFAGYRLFRFVLAIYGFYLGAMITTSSMGNANTWTLIMAAIVGGLLGAVLMYAAYFLGVGLIGAGLAAMALDAGWRFAASGTPPTAVLVIVCVLGALGALAIQRHVVVFGTAIAGAWTLIVGVLAMMGNPAATRAVTADDIWVLYPLNPLPNQLWVTGLWFVVALVGALVQLSTTSRSRPMRVPTPARA
jgi:hypothetical protein